jgi:hypothetical protein
MSNLSSTFPTDLGIASRVGLTRGVGGLGSDLGSFAEAEMHYREGRMVQDLLRRQRQRQARSDRRSHRGQRSGGEVMSRWTTWLPSVPLMHRSSPVQQSSNACGS